MHGFVRDAPGLDELFVQFRASRVETDLRADSDRVEGLLNDRASIAERNAADANKEVGEARKKAGDAIDHAAKLEKEAAQLRKRAEDEAFARVLLEERIAPRALQPNQRERIAAKLRPYASSLHGRRVHLASLAMDAEGMAFAIELSDIFTRAGIEWSDDGMGRTISSGAVLMAVEVAGPLSDHAFISAFTDATTRELNMGDQFISRTEGADVRVVVGVKPVPLGKLLADMQRQTADRRLTAEQQKRIAISM